MKYKCRNNEKSNINILFISIPRSTLTRHFMHGRLTIELQCHSIAIHKIVLYAVNEIILYNIL